LNQFLILSAQKLEIIIQEEIDTMQN